jgi:23S rRNA (adenine2503-C2)-methyltransferase
VFFNLKGRGRIMEIVNAFYLPSGRIFLVNIGGYLIECTEMRDVLISGKHRKEVRNSLDPRVIWKHLSNYQEKWLLTVSTQKGCPHNCHFCDVAGLGFEGDLTEEEIREQIILILENTPHVNYSKKVKIGFARMGEPSHNLDNVLNVINTLDNISCLISGERRCLVWDKKFTWLPCFNSILPRKTTKGLSGFDVIDRVVESKEKHHNGHLHFQISVNSTCEKTRQELFAGADVLTVDESIRHLKKHKITDRTITLNFIVMDGVEVDVQKLKKMGLTGDKFAVKLIPLNETIRSQTKH